MHLNPASSAPPGRAVRQLAAAFALCVAGSVPSAQAESGIATPVGELTLRGFGTLGIVRSNTDQAEFVRDLSQSRGASRRTTAKVDSLLGVQANLRVSEHVEFVAQAVSRYNYAANYRPEVNWAFVKFEPTANATLRAGRLGTEFYMLADSRHVGYSYVTVRPPGDYYGTLPFNYIDGGDVAATVPFAGGLLRGKLFAGDEPESLPIEGQEWSLRGSRMGGGYVDYQKGAWQWRVGAAQIRFKRNFGLLAPLLDALNTTAALTGVGQAATAAERISVAHKAARLYSAGVVYDDGPLQLQLMLSQTRNQSATYENTRAGYLIGAYRIGQFTPYAGLSWTKGHAAGVSTGLPDVAPFDAINAAVANYLRKGHTDQHTAIIGSRWDWQRNLALKAQLDIVRGRPESIFLIQRITPDYRGRMSVFSLALDFVF